MSFANPIIVFAMLVAAVLGVIGIARPFVGLPVFMVLQFIQPGELIPALAPLRLEFVYGLALFVAVLLRQTSSPVGSVFSNRIFIAGMAVVAVAAFTVPFSIWKGGSINATIYLCKLFTLLFLIASVVDTPGRLQKLLWLLTGLLAWFAGSGLSAYLHGEISLQEGLRRATGINSMAGGPNALAGMILALLPFLIANLQQARNLLVRLALVLCEAVALTALMLSGARAGLISLIALGLYYVWRSRNRIATLAICTVIALTLWIEMPQAYRDRYLTVGHYAEGQELDASNELRLHIWKTGLRMFLDHPILGVGIGQFNTAYGTIYATRLHQLWMDPHNLALEVGCEMGIMGLVAFGYFVAQIFKGVASIPRVEDQSPLGLAYQMSVACGAMLLGLVIMSAVSHTLLRPYWYLLGGLVAANWRVAQTALRDSTSGEVKESEERQLLEVGVSG